MKPRVAVLQFPGNNSEYETVRALQDAQIDAEFFRWNADPAGLAAYDGFVIPGGFSYEDRGRSGLIASMDPIMAEIRRQAELGKPVLGICNGAQIVVESGLVPGGKDHALLLSLARNKRVRGGEVIGVGFYNENVFIKASAPQGRCAFTLDIAQEERNLVPIAHGEGRFTTRIPGLLEQLREHEQIVFKYCSAEGMVGEEFPLNPNGAMDSAAAICNTQGNVMAIMPHPERAPVAPMPKIFSSMRRYMEERALGNQPLGASAAILRFDVEEKVAAKHEHRTNTVEFLVELIITDNEAQTLENALRHHGFPVCLRKWTSFEVLTKPGEDQQSVAETLIRSGEICNLNKERVIAVGDSGVMEGVNGMSGFKKDAGSFYYFVRELEDAAGLALTARLGRFTQKGVLWEVKPDVGTTVDEAALLKTHVFANPNAQILERGI